MGVAHGEYSEYMMSRTARTTLLKGRAKSYHGVIVCCLIHKVERNWALHPLLELLDQALLEAHMYIEFSVTQVEVSSLLVIVIYS